MESGLVPQDEMYEYAKEHYDTIGFLVREFVDTVREGDGDRIIRVLKFIYHCTSSLNSQTILH